MKKIVYLLLILLNTVAVNANAQIDSVWRYLSVDNTGLGGEFHEAVNSDKFGNVWMGGSEIFFKRGSIVRIKDGEYTNWGNYEGFLPDDRVHAIAFDNYNHLWLGSREGVTRFDGKEWKTWNTQNSALGADYVMAIAVDPTNNHIWVASRPLTSPSDGRISVFNGTSWTVYSTSNSSLASNFVTDIAVDQNGVKWIATNKGLQKFDGTNWTLYNNLNSGVNGPEVLSVKVDQYNKVWCTSGNGSSIAVSVEVFDGTNWSRLSNFPVSNYHPELVDTKDEKIILAELGSFARILIKNGNNWEVHQPKGQVFDVHIDSANNYWAVGKGFASKYDGQTWTHYTKNNTGMASYFHKDFFVDSKNRKWLANGNGGIQVFDCNEWRSYGPLNEGLFPSPQMQSSIGTSITEDASNGDIWITYTATYGYAVRIPNGDINTPNNWVLYDWQAVGSPFFASIEKSLANGKGQVAFVNYSGKVFIHDIKNNTWNYYNTQAEGGPLHASVYNIGSDSSGSFYFGGYRKITKWNKGTWSIIDLMQMGSTQGGVNMIKFDAEDKMWIATTDGLWKLDNGTWLHFDTSNSGITGWNVRSITFKNNKVYTTAYDLTNWPYSGGFSVYDGSSWQSSYQSQHPLTHYQIDDLQFDTLGNLWLMCAEGLTIYNSTGVKGFECIDEKRDTLDGAMPAVIMGIAGTEKSSIGFEVYPNPANDLIQIKANNMSEDAICRVIDLQGRVVIERKYSEIKTTGLAVDGLNAGVYLLQLSNEVLRLIVN